VPSIISHIILGVIIFNATIGVIESVKATKRNALEIAQSVRATLYFIWACYMQVSHLQGFLKSEMKQWD